MRIPFIKVNQKGEIFYISKINALDLRKYVNFEFRDPYNEKALKNDIINYDKYINKITGEEITQNSNPKGIQRKLQIDKINSIKKYLENNVDNFFPNSVILSLNVQEDNLNSIYELEDQDMGLIEVNDGDYFNIIDGQHRLAGIFMCGDDIVSNFDIPVVLLIDISVSNAVKIFLDINSNQKKVDKSLVYDLYEDLDDKEIEDIKKIHMICKKMYINQNSPLYRQIKMLGVGSGAISQAFFIDTVIESIKFIDMVNESTQYIYNHLFSYFRAYQRTFPKDWPLKLESQDMSIEELDNYSKQVLIINKSQLLKTTGFGAIMNAFEYIYKKSQGDYKNYYNIVSKLKGNISWRHISGTGKSKQKELSNRIIDILEGNYRPINYEGKLLLENLTKIEQIGISKLSDKSKYMMGTIKDEYLNIIELFKVLNENNIVDAEDFDRIKEIQKIRNIMVHSDQISVEDILEAINLQNIIIENLEGKQKI
ncbi:MAG: DGQHR domain-containing protein [Paraclostridium sp.]